MNLLELRVGVIPGTGLAINLGTALVVAFPASTAQERTLDDILAIVDTLIEEEPETPGRKLARRVVGVLAAADPDEVLAFGVLAVGDRGLAVLLQGDVDLHVGDQLLSGRDVSTWLDRIVDADVGHLAMHASGHHASPDPRSDLRAGSVPGGGLVLEPRVGGAPPLPHPRPAVAQPGPGPVVPPAPPEAPAVDEPTLVQPDSRPSIPPPLVPQEAEPPAEFVSVSLAEPLPAEELQPLAVLSPDTPGSAATGGPAPAASGAELQGILCSRQHFNDPNALYCSSCGISMVHQTHNLVTGVRPPLGILLLDDGSAFVLDGDYVIGREPDLHPEVQGGRARPLVVADPETTTSRVHAWIRLEGWDVHITDLGSANGSFVAESQATDWTRLTPSVPVAIRPGSRFHVGGRNFIFESHHRA